MYWSKIKGGHVRIYLKRWFELRGNFLFYFVNQNESVNTVQQPRGFLNIKGATIDTRSVRKLKIYIISRLLPRIYELKCESVTEYERWVRHLRSAANYKPEQDIETLNKVSHIYHPYLLDWKQIKQEIEQGGASAVIFSFDEAEKAQNEPEKKQPSLEDFELLVFWVEELSERSWRFATVRLKCFTQWSLSKKRK